MWMGIPIVIIAAVAGTWALSQFSNYAVVVGVLSITVAVLTAITTFLNPRERANAHLSAGNNYDSLLTRVRMFWTIDCWGDDSEGLLATKLKDFSEQRDRLNRECPQVPRFAYVRAKKGIAEGEASYKVDENVRKRAEEILKKIQKK